MSQLVINSTGYIYRDLSKNPSYVPITFTKNSGMLIINISQDEFTDEMKMQMPAVSATIYSADGSEYVPILDKCFIWQTTGTDMCIPIYDVPNSCYISIAPVFNEYHPKDKLIDKFPVLCTLDNTPIESGSSGSGGSGLPDVTDSDNDKILQVVNGEWQIVGLNVITDAVLENFTDVSEVGA